MNNLDDVVREVNERQNTIFQIGFADYKSLTDREIRKNSMAGGKFSTLTGSFDKNLLKEGFKQL